MPVSLEMSLVGLTVGLGSIVVVIGTSVKVSTTFGSIVVVIVGFLCGEKKLKIGWQIHASKIIGNKIISNFRGAKCSFN
jgi:hypothetical protein